MVNAATWTALNLVVASNEVILFFIHDAKSKSGLTTGPHEV